MARARRGVVAAGGGGPVVVVGLTGGIASGKSTAAAALQACGAPVVRSDALAREVVAPGTRALAEIRAAFGPQVLAPDGTLARRVLAERIFADPAARRRLEEITHPRIHRRMLRWLQERRGEGAPAAVCDIPLLFEAGYDRRGGFLDRIWVVRVDAETQLRRLMARDGLDPAAAAARLAAQWPLEAKAARAQLVLENAGSPEELAAVAQHAWRRLRQELGLADA